MNALDFNKRSALRSRGTQLRSLEPWLLPLLPAAIAAAGLVELLLFLHPSWDPLDASLLRGVLHFAAILAPVSIVAHLFTSRVFKVRVRRILPWSLILLVATGAVTLGGHASYYSFYLPPVLNDRMVRAALWLALGAAVGFYTALAHSIHWRRYGSRTLAFFLLLGTSAVLVPYERRLGFTLRPHLSPRLPAPEPKIEQTLVWIELPGASMDLLLPLAEQGRLPFLASILERGAAARLTGLEPTLPLAARWSLRTGLQPDQHRVLGLERWKPSWSDHVEIELLPLLPGFRRWGLLQAQPVPRVVQGLDHPDLPRLLASCGYQAKVLEGTAAAPPTNAQGWGPLPRRSAAERELELLGSPNLAADLLRDRAALTAVRLALEKRGDSERRAVFTVLEGFERASRSSYGALTAVELGGRRGRLLERRAAALATYYAAVDRELEELASELPAGTLLVLVSPYGMSSPSTLAWLWGEISGSPPWGGTLRGGPDGLLLLQGPGFLGGNFLERAELVDVVPTLLYALGLPGARDLPGRLLVALFEPEFLQKHPLTFLPSYLGVPQGPALR